MSDKLSGSNDMEKLKDLAARPYKAQAVWFLNSFWDDVGQANSEKIWLYVEKIAKFDLQKGTQGCEVDELQMHKFLEAFQETMTVREMRDTLRAKGAIGDAVKLIALIHYLIFRFNIDFHVLVNAHQGDNRKELEEAQRMLDEVSRACQEAEAKAQAAKAALAKAKAEEAEAKKAEAEAKKAEAEAKQRETEAHNSAEQAKQRETDAKSKAQIAKQKEAEAKSAQDELEAALHELKAQEDAFNAKTEDLKRKSEEGSVVSQNKAKNELAQHLASDPLPLRKAKITQEAAVKKAERATKAAAEARTASEAAANEATKARKAAEESAKQASNARAVAEEAARRAEDAARKAEASRKASEEATRQAEAALDEMQKRVDEAEAYLNEVKSRPGKAAGAIWFMERELFEKKKFMPERKGGIAK